MGVRGKRGRRGEQATIVRSLSHSHLSTDVGEMWKGEGRGREGSRGRWWWWGRGDINRYAWERVWVCVVKVCVRACGGEEKKRVP